MRDSSTIMKERQRTIRDQLVERNISLKTIAFDSGIPYSTLCSYFPGNERGKVERVPAEMPAGAVASLCGVLPGDLLSAILPDGFSIVRTPEGIDHDEADKACREYADAKAAAHHPESEAGRDIGPKENALLCERLTLVRAA